MNPEELQERVDQALNELDEAVEELFGGEFDWRELTRFLSEAIDVANMIFPEDAPEDDKTALVMEVWKHYDKDYNLTQKIDDLIPFEKVLGKPVGSVFEIWDGTVLKNLVERILLPLLASVIYPEPASAG